MRALLPERVDELVLLAAHCDDIAVGAGGTLLRLCTAHPEIRVRALVLTGGGTERADEERMALAAFCPKAEIDLTVLTLPDGRVPGHWAEAKSAVETLRANSEPDLILAPALHDAHQDHRTLARLVPTAFRDHPVLGYEILKWDSDLVQPQVYQPLTGTLLEEKVALLHRYYPSQRERAWFDTESFTGLARIRGVQCHERYAEAFHISKLVLDTGRG